MKLAYLAFTNTGKALAERIAEKIGGTVSRCNQPEGHREWTERNFRESDGLVFVGAAGIAVRSIAPFLKSKAEDPAVVVVDECGKFAISLVSGHLGGANELAERIAGAIGAVPVVTTATDRHGVFAVDDWARRQGCIVAEPERILPVSSALLAGKKVDFYSEEPVSGQVPEGICFWQKGEAAERPKGRLLVELGRDPQFPNALHLLPKNIVLGIGCRKGVPAEQLETGFRTFLEETGLDPRRICGAASIDLKKEEPGILEFCKVRGWSYETWPAAELTALEGDFTKSEFVASVTGVDNVCERSALRSAGDGGRLVIRKYAENGVTFAAAEKAVRLTWGEK